MGESDRGRFTISTNIILTVSLVTRTLTFGLTMLIAYMKAEDAIFDDNAIKMMNLDTSYRMPMGSAMRSMFYCIIGVFLVEFITGIFGSLGALCKVKNCLVTTVFLSSFMLTIYTVYFVILALLYDKTNNLHNTLAPYSDLYWMWRNHGYNYYWTYMSDTYGQHVYPGFFQKLGCGESQSQLITCSNVYKEQVRPYLKTYFGVISTCFVCHVVSIVASEYTYRKLEFKEKKTGLSRNNYFLLFTLRHGMGRKFILFVRRSWRTSKLIFFSSILKVVSMVVSLGLLGLGLVLSGDVMITDGSLKYVFYQLQFYQYYFYDILIGLCASSVVLGVLGAVSSILGIVGSLRHSTVLAKLSCLTSTILLLPKIVVLIFWSVLIVKINNNLKYQLKNQQNGYYYDDKENSITTEWNNMILTLDCCGVYSHNETHSGMYGKAFCCNIASEIIMDPYRSYKTNNYIFDHHGGCGGDKTKTCTSVILWKTRMYVGWFLGIVLLLIILEIIGIILMNKEYHIDHVESQIDDTKRGRCYALKPFLTIFTALWTGLKSFLSRYCRRRKSGITYFVSILFVFVFSLALMAIAVRIRYDEIFGNRDIRPLLDRVNITETTFTDAIDNFSTVVITFELATLAAVIYSITIMAPRKVHRVFTYVNFALWTCLIIANVINIGLWAKFSTDVTSKVNDTFEDDIKLYRYSQMSGLSYYDQISFHWNTLFVKAKCCGSSSPANLTFIGSYWDIYNNRDYTGQQMPMQCCTTQIDVYPYDDIRDNSCIYHEENCPKVIADRLSNNYSIPFFILTAIIVLAEVVIVISTIILMRNKTSQDETVELVRFEQQDPARNASVETKVPITGNVVEPNTKAKTLKRESSRISALSRSWKVEPEQSNVDEYRMNSTISKGNLRRRERSLRHSVKKETDQSDVYTKSSQEAMSKGSVENETETKKASKGKRSKRNVRKKTESNNNIDTESMVNIGTNDEGSETKTKNTSPPIHPKEENIEIKNDHLAKEIPKANDFLEENSGTLAAAWQTSEDFPDTSITSFHQNIDLRSSIQDESIGSVIESNPKNDIEISNDVDVEEL